MRFLFRLIVLIVVVVMLGAAAVAFLVPTDYIRDQIVSLVEQQTGRMLAVKGETSFSLYPNIGVNMGDVTLSNPPGMEAGSTLQIAALNLNLKLLPLIGGQVEVDRFVLTRPVFNLQIDRAGRRNWDLERRADLDAPARRTALHGRAIRAQAGGGASMFQDLSLGDVRIEDGVLQFSDQRSGAQHRADAINLTLALASLSEPFDAVGDLVWRDQKVAIDAELATLQSLMQNQPTKMQLMVDAAPLKGTFKGQVVLGDSFRLTGQTSGESPSVRALARWLGTGVPAATGFGPASVEGTVDATPQAVAFSKMRLGLDGMTGEGDAQIRLDTARPYLKATLRLDKIDVNPYLGEGRSAAAPAPRARQAAPVVAQPKGPAPSPKSDQSLSDFIQDLDQQDQGSKSDRAPQVRGWSQTAFNFAGLRLLDADLNLTAGQLLYQRLKVGRSAVVASLRSGVLTSDLREMQLYNGRGSGRITLNAAQAVPGLNATFNVDRVEALPLLRDAMEFDWISGRARFTLNLAGRGRSQSEMVRSLNGNGSFEFTNGAIEGLNIPQMLRGLQGGQLQGWNRAERMKTDFSRMTGTYTMQNGIARNDDLDLIGPLLRMKGAGIVDFPRERIDYTIEPRVVASLQGQGGERDLEGLEIPVKIEGSWDNPKFKPDVERLLQNPEKTIESVKKLRDKFKDLKESKDVGKLLNQFLGQGQGQTSQGGEAQPGQDQAQQGQAQQGQVQQEQSQQGQSQQGQAQPNQAPQEKRARPEDLLDQLFR